MVLQVAIFKTRDIEKALLAKGFQVEQTHHEYFWFYYNGKRTHIKTRISHGKKEYGSNLISAIKKQLKLQSKQQIEDLLNCPMSEEDYIELLLSNGEVD